MARSCGGGGFHGSSHHARVRRRRNRLIIAKSVYQTASYPFRRSYVNSKGDLLSYYTSVPFDISLKPAEFKKSTFGKELGITIMSFVIIVCLGLFSSISSIYKHQPLKTYNSGYVVIEDNMGVFQRNGKEKLEASLRQFGRETGIIPYIYTTNSLLLNGKTYNNLKSYAMDLYYAKFHDESHFLIVYLPSHNAIWGIQGDRTYPLLSDSAYNRFKSELSSYLRQIPSKTEAFAAAISNLTDRVLKESKIAPFMGLLYLSVIGFIVTIISDLPFLIKLYKQAKEYELEYIYYQENGLPPQPEQIYDACPKCGLLNRQFKTVCPICSYSLVKQEAITNIRKEKSNDAL